MNEYDKVMTQNLAQSLMNQRHIGLASEAVTKLPLHHAKGGFDARALGVMLQKLGSRLQPRQKRPAQSGST
jgi:hypothetical protein